jgi:virginiamycin B lyase
MRNGARFRGFVFVAMVLAAVATSMPSAGALPGEISEWPLVSGGTPDGLAAGPDGNVWVTERVANDVVRFSPDGFVVSVIPLRGAPASIAQGDDGAMWVVERSGNRIARVRPNGTVDEWSVPGASNGLFAIARGPDGAMWFTERSANQIGRISSTGDITEYDVPTDGALPTGIALGPDGDLWFTEFGTRSVGRITPAGSFRADVPLPASGASPQGISAGPNGTVWTVGTVGGGLLRIDTATRDVAEVITGLHAPVSVVHGPDRAMWVTERSSNEIARWDLRREVLSEFVDQSAGGPAGLAVGPDLNVWFTAPTSDVLGVIGTDTTPPDTTKPTITIFTPEDGATYRRGDRVLADYECADEPGGSGLAECEGTVPDGQPIDTDSAGSHDFTVKATDHEGNSRTETVSYTVLEPPPADTTPPTITIRSPVEHATYLVGDRVVARFSCRDEDGGSGIASCVGTVDDGRPIDTSVPGRRTFEVTASDAAGNVSTARASYSVQAPKPADTTPPTVTLDVPQDGAAFMVGDPVLAAYACADEGGSGLASCSGTVPNGAPLDMSTPGIFTFTVTAVDGAGNRTTVAHTYVVFVEWGGKLELAPAMNEVTAGSAVPIWFSFGDASTASTKAATSPTSTPIDCLTLAPTGPSVPASVSPTGGKAPSGRVMYVWKTDRAWAGTCRAFTLGIAAPTTLYIRFP